MKGITKRGKWIAIALLFALLLFAVWAGITPPVCISTDTSSECASVAATLTHQEEGNFFGEAIANVSGMQKRTTSLDGLWYTLVAVGVLGVSVLFKLFFGKQPVLSPTVNFTVPDEMDPLLMGKLFDNSIDKEDIGAMIFHFAQKGYLDIKMLHKTTLLRRLVKELPPEAPAHQKILFDGLFHDDKQVVVSQLNRTFYETVDKMKKTLVHQPLYEKDSYVKILFLGLFVTFAFGIFSFFMTKRTTPNANDFFGFLIGGGSYAMSLFYAIVVMNHSFKWKKTKRYFVGVGGVFLGMVVTFILIMCSISTLGKNFYNFILGLSASVAGILGGNMLIRTKDYTQKLGKIIGFRNFLLFTEKDRIKFMLQENPTLYYKILPYAQVLGVTKVWTDKFDGNRLYDSRILVDENKPNEQEIESQNYFATYQSFMQNFSISAFMRDKKLEKDEYCERYDGRD